MSGGGGIAGGELAEGEFTRDTLLHGRVTLLQPARGFRSSLDPVLLAAFLRPPIGRFLDVGCGTGAVAFLLLAADSEARGIGLEIQPRLARLAARAAALNGFGPRFEMVEADARVADLPPGGFDLVATNPPFRPLGAGALPPDRERSIAHHEVALTLPDWVRVAGHALRPGGRLGVVFPADRLPALVERLLAGGFALARLRFVHPQPGAPPQRVLVEAIRAADTPAIVEPPLVVHDGRAYSAEMRTMLGEG